MRMLIFFQVLVYAWYMYCAICLGAGLILAFEGILHWAGV